MKLIMESWRKFLICEKPTRGATTATPIMDEPPPETDSEEDHDSPPGTSVSVFLKYREKAAASVRPHPKLHGKGMYIVNYGFWQHEGDTRPSITLHKDTAYKFRDFIEEYTQNLGQFTGPLHLSGRAPALDHPSGPKTTRGSKSQHKFGRAIDLQIPEEWRGPSRSITWKMTVMTIAIKHGFTSFGFGQNTVHIDTRKRAGWWAYEKGKPIVSYNFVKYAPLVPWEHPHFPNLISTAKNRQNLCCYLDSLGQKSPRNKCSRRGLKKCQKKGRKKR